MSIEKLYETALAWADADIDVDDAAEIRALVGQARKHPGAEQEASLRDRFSGPLAFGTAGLRGELGAGQHRMNRAVVVRAAAGLAAYLVEHLGATATPRVVIGFDARRGSHRFAQDSAATLAAQGIEVSILPSPLPTPVLAFALRHLEADAGVMVTASHNPARDNGYKVYLGGRMVPGTGQGSQIVPPADTEIAAHIAAVGAAKDVPRSHTAAQASGGSVSVIGDDLAEAYLSQALAAGSQVSWGGSGTGGDSGDKTVQLTVVYTAMHGVGADIAEAGLARLGFVDLHSVSAQREPDPDFPTAPFPNPEEPGTLDLAFALANEVGADLVIANDPDADRLSLALPDEESASGWRQLLGDEVGALFAEAAARTITSAGVRPQRNVLANSVVSSQLMAKIAHAHGLEYHATLTGFKWISRVPDLGMGYEEALGYCLDPEHVRDKDGISAAIAAATLAHEAKASGSSLAARLDELAMTYGVHATAQYSLRTDEIAVIKRIMTGLRAQPPASFGGAEVTGRRDLLEAGEDLPATDALIYTTANSRVIVRPSGTEPKVKCYLEVVAELGNSLGNSDVASAEPAGVEPVSVKPAGAEPASAEPASVAPGASTSLVAELAHARGRAADQLAAIEAEVKALLAGAAR